MESRSVQIYGHLDKIALNTLMDSLDLVLMPSLFLETFGLVALETLSHGIPVIGFARGGLIDFIHPSLTLDPHAPIDSFFDIIDTGIYPLNDISVFAYSHWMESLERLTHASQRILLVSDYVTRVG